MSSMHHAQKRYKQSLGRWRWWLGCLEGIHCDLTLLNLVEHGLYSGLEVSNPPIHLVKVAYHHMPEVVQLIQDDGLSVRQC